MVYRNVKPLDGSKAAVNYGVDLLHKDGVGGRIRVVGIDDIVPESPGTELAAIRVFWKTGTGGRADAIIARIKPLPIKLLGRFHECWNAKGLRTAYADTVAGNDKDNPNEGDVTACFGLESSDVPESAAALNGADPDPEVDALLQEAEADEIDATAADEPVNAELQ